MRTHLSGAILAAFLTTAAPGTGVAQDGASARRTEPRPATSFELIDRALEAKEIDEETAHKYRVFAAFGDSRVPARYRGDDSGFEEFPPSVEHAGALLETFSPRTRADLEPFFLRPDAPGSWVSLGTVGGQRESPAGGGSAGASQRPLPAGRGPFDTFGEAAGTAPTIPGTATAQAVQWHVVPAVGGKAKVWYQTRYPGDSAKAVFLAAALTRPIWRELTGLFGDPLPDDQACFPLTGICRPIASNGGGPEFDVYLVHLAGNKGEARLAHPGTTCNAMAPYYLLLDSRRPLVGTGTSGMVQTLAHELTHAITMYGLAADCSKYQWIREATGKWSESWVYPKQQSEQEFANDYLSRPDEPLDYSTGANVQDRHYGTYLFPFWLVMNGDLIALQSMWHQFRSMEPLAGIDAALGFDGSSLEEAFPKFAVRNWNRPPVDDYEKLDKLTIGATGTVNPTQVSAPPGSYTEKQIILPVVHYLAARYAYYSFDASVRMLTFTNTLDGIPHAAVWGIEKIKGQWQQPVDWSDEPGKTWCRNDAAEDIEELVIVFSNKDWKKKLDVEPLDHPVLKAFSTECSGWVGTVNFTLTMTAPDLGTLVETATTTVRFEVDPDLVQPGQPREYWRAVSGDIQWGISYTGGDCTGSFQGTIPISLPPDGNHMADLHIFDDGSGKLLYTGSAGPWPEQYTPRRELTCKDPDQPPPTVGPIGFQFWWATNPMGEAVSADGKTLGGTWEAPGLDPDSSMKWRWRFRPG